MPSILLTGQSTAISSTTNVTGLNATTGVTLAWWQFGIASADGTQSPVAGWIINHSSGGNDARDGYMVGWSANQQLTFYALGSAGSTVSTAGTYSSQSGKWQHYTVVFENSSNSVWFYENGKLLTRVANTRDMTANASTTTRIGSYAGSFTNADELRGAFFDLQIFPDVVVPPQDVPILMRPLDTYPGCKGRYFGIDCGAMDTGGVGVIRDESGSGNHLGLSNPPNKLELGPEPPFRFTIA